MRPALLRWDEPGAVADVAARLRGGALLALPTETVYGLSCLATDAAAVAQVAALKGIGAPRGFAALVASAAMALEAASTQLDRRAARFLRAAWPAPLTAVLPVPAALPWSEERDVGWTAAFRVPSHAILLQVLGAVGEPVLSTSANRTGEPPLTSPEAIVDLFGSALDAVAIEEKREDSDGRASTVADFTVWPPRSVRAGRFDLHAALGEWNG
jgi:L-threonylcarbamoyladenylate synthase